MLNPKQSELPVAGPAGLISLTISRHQFEPGSRDVESKRRQIGVFARNSRVFGQTVFLRKNRLSRNLRTYQRPESTGNVLHPYDHIHIDGSRGKERKKYEDFQAAIPLRGAPLKELLDAGHVPIPYKWVDTIKNFHERLKPDYVPEFKFRLVSRGNFEDSPEVRTDAPTSDLETHALVAAFAAAHGVPVESSDIRNAYFQAEP